jgi:hypothetical protein
MRKHLKNMCPFSADDAGTFSFCCGDTCMAWRTLEPEKSRTIYGLYDNQFKALLELSGVSYTYLMKNMEDIPSLERKYRNQLPKPDKVETGYCGLVGKP